MRLNQDINYNLLGYHKKLTFDLKGDKVIVEYYRNFDGTNYLNLKVRETRVYTRDGNTGILIKRDMTIDWILDTELDGEVIQTTKQTTKYYTPEQGYEQNKRSRGNLINKASMYLLSQVQLSDAQNFLRLAKVEISGYTSGDMQPLLDIIANSSESYMTPTIKNTLNTILNVSYLS